MNNNVWAFIFAAIGCSVTIGTILWRVIVLKLERELLTLKHSLELKDVQITNLQDVQNLTYTGFQANFTHFSTRMKAEVVEIEKQLRQIEHFLSKTTDYQPRE